MKLNAVKTLQKNLLEEGLKLSQDEVREVLKALEVTMQEIGESLEEKEYVSVGCVTLKKKFIPERKGVSKLKPGQETEWVKPAHYKVEIKLKNALDKLLTEEV